MVDLKETTIVNAIAILTMWYLLHCRRKNRESIYTEDKLYDGMVIACLAGAAFEMVTFWVDGRDFIGGRFLNYLSNSLCYAGTVTIAFIWCMYVELHVYHNYKRMVRDAKFLAIPWFIEIAVIIINLFGTGLMFTVSEENVYHRNTGVIIGYITLMIYFAYSIYLVLHSRKHGINLDFFPVQYFVGPCILGNVVQFVFYGISTSWISVAIALIFVQMQIYAENIYMDELSGLFNRRYMNGVLAKREKSNLDSMYGIMLDINSFKSINDNFGHDVGDKAICCMADALSKSLPDGGMAIRYAGDEFIVLLPDVEEVNVKSTMEEINNNLDRFNKSGAEKFNLRASMGYARFEFSDTAESFLSKMDTKMYEGKRRYYEEHPELSRRK